MGEGGVAIEEAAKVEKEVSPSISPLARTVLMDLAITSGGNTDISRKNIGSVLRGLRSQAERGISLQGNGIKVSSSIEEVLPTDLLQDAQNEIVCHNEPIPRQQDEWGNKLPFFKDEGSGKFFDGDAYERVLELQKTLYGDRVDVRLVRHNNNLIVIAEHQVGDRIKVTQVLDCDFPQTADYKEFQRKVREENVDLTPWPFGQGKKEIYIPAQHLIIEDTQSGKMVDLRTLLPDDWSLRYVPTESLAFSQDSDGKYLKYSEITSPELLIAALHEYGHSVLDANNNPELFREAKELWIDSKFTTGGPRGLPEEVFKRTKALLVQNERGASARAFQALRILHEQGLDLGVSINRVIDITNDALKSYEKGYPGGQTRFIRTNNQKNPPSI